ncbi:MAG: PLP-dependent aminotransferase family protein [Cocleimonas sp.]|nr:PLP-dependent aminotransferase family protein [Cocleimonas sp.]
MKNLLSNRIQNVPESFIRRILKVSTQSDVISFAGGLPSSDLFPVQGLQDACNKVLEDNPTQTLQYANSEGDDELRAWIAKRYKEKQGLDISVDNILITNGSQQALDLLGKVLLNEGDSIAIENPGYLGAIQSFSLYQPKMHTVAIDDNGLNVEQLTQVLADYKPKLLYTVPNFQNPTGISYSQENREAVAGVVSQFDTLLIQDDPYGELRFSGAQKSNFYELLPEQTLLLGSFSKVVVPSFRLGWIVAPDWLMKPLVIAKQAADLHTNYFSQQVIFQYLKDNALDDHIEKIIQFYGKQKQVMMDAIKQYFPADVTIAESEGGMFLWVALSKEMSAMALFDKAIKEKVAFVPGKPFYVGDETEENTLRLSYVTVNEEKIIEGIKRLGRCINQG